MWTNEEKKVYLARDLSKSRACFAVENGWSVICCTMFWLEYVSNVKQCTRTHQRVFVARERESICMCMCVCFGTSWIQNNRHMQHLSNTSNPPSRHVVTMPIDHNTFDAHAYTYMHTCAHTDIVLIGIEAIARAHTHIHTHGIRQRSATNTTNHCRYHRQCRIISCTFITAASSHSHKQAEAKKT